MSLTRTFLKNASARTTNSVTTALAEAIQANWTKTAGATALTAQTAAGGGLGTPLSFEGAADSAWAKSTIIDPGASGGGIAPTDYYICTPTATVGSTTGHKVSIFVRRPTSDPAGTFTFQYHNDNTGGGTAGDHSVVMTYDSTTDSWKMTNANFGAIGMQCPEQYPDGWKRLEFFYQRRQHGNNLELAVAANVLTFRISCEASKKLHIWGLLYEIPATTTILVPTEQAITISDNAGTDAFSSTTLTIDEGTVVTFTNSTGSNAVISSTGTAAESYFAFNSGTVANAGTYSYLFLQSGTYPVITDNGGTLTVYVRKTATGCAPVVDLLKKSPASPYLNGIVGSAWPYGAGGPWSYRPGLRADSRQGLFQVSMQSTPTASVVMLGRTGPDAPWETVQTTTQGDVDALGGEVDAVALYPEMRFAITVWTAGTLGAWLAE